MTERLQSSVPPEILFIERCTQLLVDGGRMGIVLPDSILGSPGLGYIREWLIKNHRIVASIDLNADTFQPRNGTQTSVLFLQRKRSNRKIQRKNQGKWLIITSLWLWLKKWVTINEEIQFLREIKRVTKYLFRILTAFLC